MMDDTGQLIAQENVTCLSSIGPAASESGTLTDSVEFWSWMDRNYANSGHFASSENMRSYMSGTPGQQNWAKKVVQGKGYEWDWMSSQRKQFKNLFKCFDAGDVANRLGSDITAKDIITGAEKKYGVALVQGTWVGLNSKVEPNGNELDFANIQIFNQLG